MEMPCKGGLGCTGWSRAKPTVSPLPAVGSHLAHHLAAPEPNVDKLFHQLMSSTEVIQLWVKYVPTFLTESYFYFIIGSGDFWKERNRGLSLTSVSALGPHSPTCDSITEWNPGAQGPSAECHASRMENSTVEDQVNGRFKFIVIEFHDYSYSEGI